MSTHTIAVEIEVEISADEVAYPTIEITYDYSRGYPAHTPRGEYAPIDPPEPPGIEFRGADLIKSEKLSYLGPFPNRSWELPALRMQELAEEWLLGPGYHYAVDAAETDLKAMRHAQ